MGQLQIIPLGGANEIGRNCNIVIQDNDMIIVDVGLSFPDEEMHGVEIVIPDFTFIIENKKKLKGIFLTHAHEDHIGALAYLLPQVHCPIYGTEFTLAMVKNKLAEKMDIKKVKLHTIKSGDIVQVGSLSVEPIRVTHSIPENCAMAIRTHHGIVLYTSDFKFDFTPVDGKLTDIDRLAELSKEGVIVLLSDCTNVDRHGWSASETSVKEGLLKVFQQASGRVFLTTFSSNIHRMQQAFDAAEATGRKVVAAGRRIEQSIDLCIKLGYMNVNPETRINIEKISSFPPEKIVILTTGSQGEPLSALVKLSKDKYSRLKIREGDTILYSARPIPGNEGAIWRTVNRLFRMGAEVIYESSTPIHASGHGHQEEIKMMINLTRPYYLAPIHGEPRHQFLYTKMAQDMGHPKKRIFSLNDGLPLCIDEKTAWIGKPIRSGEVYVDKAGKVGGITEQIMHERSNLSNHGIIVAHVTMNKKTNKPLFNPTIQSKGFSGNPRILDEAENELMSQLQDSKFHLQRSHMNQFIIETVGRFLSKNSGYKPLIVACVVEV